MTLISKAKRIGETAQRCFDAGDYDSAISRAYYWYFLHLLYWASLPKLKRYLKVVAGQTDGHAQLAQAFLRDLGKRSNDIDMESLRAMMFKLRDARHAADYSARAATKAEAQAALALAGKLIALLQREYTQ